MVVTGATNELGKEFITHFNKNGFNVIMVDEDNEALEKAKNDIQSKTEYSGKIELV